VRTALVLALLAGALAAPAAGTPRGGLYGTVWRGPITPVCEIGVPCERPAAHAVFVLTRNGTDTRVVTDGAGHYRVRLAPGRYRVHKNDWGPGDVRPSSIVVPSGHFARRNFHIDTGIR
jgi:hypothetical protein